MTGTMHLATFSSFLIGMLQQSIVEIQYAHITNENHAIEFISKVENILNLWQFRSGTYTWGTAEELQLCEDLLLV